MKRLQTFSRKYLIYYTALPVFFSLFSFTDDDHGVVVLVLAGFIYSFVLYYSMIIKPTSQKVIVGMIILGLANLFVYSTSAILMFLPKEIIDFTKYLPPSLTGAMITLLVLNYLWSSNIAKTHCIIILSIVALGSLLTPILEVLIYSIFPATSIKGLFYSLNVIIWWISFTLGLVITQDMLTSHLKRV